MAGFSDEAEPIAAALLSAASGVSALRDTSGGFSVGGPLGTGDAGARQRGGDAGAGDELARNGTAIWIELEDGGGDCETGSALWIAPS